MIENMTLSETMTITRHGRRFWRVYDEDGSLVCVTAYLKGAREVVRRLRAARGQDEDRLEEDAPKGAVRKKGEK